MKSLDFVEALLQVEMAGIDVLFFLIFIRD
jgi:hypothetical protein